MSGKSEVVSESRFDGIKWSVVAILVFAGAFGNYYFSEDSVLYRALALVVLAVIAGFIALQTAKGSAFWNLVKEAKAEIRKVVWPTRQETVQTTLIVVAVVIIMGLILWGVDSLLGWIVGSLIG